MAARKIRGAEFAIVDTYMGTMGPFSRLQRNVEMTVRPRVMTVQVEGGIRTNDAIGYSPFGFANLEWISRMSPWCTVAT
jgi:hypothetical protein